MKKCVLVICLWLGFSSVSSLYAAEYLRHETSAQSVEIVTDTGIVTVKALNESAFEVFYQPEGVKQLPSYAIADTSSGARLRIVESADSLVVSAEGLSARIQKSPFSIKYHHNGKLLLEEEAGLFAQDTVRGFRFKLQDQEQIMGGGQRVLGMDRRGERLPLYNRAHYGYGTQSHQMYYSLPAIMSTNKYALVFDNSANGHLDIGFTEKDVLQFEAVGGRTSYIVVAGQNYPDLIEAFTDVTGRQPLPPRWALGNFASRFGYHTEQETRDTVNKFLELDFPLDAVVLDLFWFGPDIQGHMGNLDWDRQAFPEPEKMIADFNKLGVNTVVITEPFILTTSNNWADAVKNNALATNHAGKPGTFDFYFGNTGLVDVFSESGRKWFSGFYEKLFAQGVTGWWGDLGEPEVHPADSLHNLDGVTATGDEIHNAYGHKWAEMVYNTHRRISIDTRPMIMMRSGFVGSQRYGIIPWTGDVSRSWDGLKPQVELSLQMSLFGLAYTHSDLGGFAGGETFDKEMYIRWLQYGVFQPVYRPHAQEAIAPEPVFHDKETQDIVREYIKLRYQLLPYNYSLAFENSLTGMPLMRPMFFEQDGAIDDASQYMWGDSFLVKPVTEPGLDTVSVSLPSGVWFDYFSGKPYEGGKTVTIPTSLTTLPVMVRAGALIPMTQSVQSTSQYDGSELLVHYYADSSAATSSSKMYDDNGQTPDTIVEQAYQILEFKAGYKNNEIRFDATVQGSFKGAPNVRDITLVVHNLQQRPHAVDVNGAFVKSGPGLSWDESKGLLKVKAKLQEAVTIKIK